MNKKIKIAVVGYGNIGCYAVQAIQAATDFELCGVVSQRSASILKLAADIKVVSDITELEGVDVALVCLPSQLVPNTVKQLLQRHIHTVDSFDIHSEIVALRAQLKKTALANNCVAITAAGWDPGSDSMVRALLLAMAPIGMTFTNFGPGMSMGHSVAVKMLAGVDDAVALTIPMGEGVHRRLVYVKLREGASASQVEQAIVTSDYFKQDETYVKFVSSVAQYKDCGHGVRLQHKGVAGQTHNQRFEYTMQINNPAVTAQIMVSAARAATRQSSGAYTMIEVPLIDYLAGQREEIIATLV